MKATIELDCAPGCPRPGDLIEGVIEGTGLPSKKPVSKFFGCWVWEYDVTPEEWKRVQPTLQERITELYHAGAIRFGSW